MHIQLQLLSGATKAPYFWRDQTLHESGGFVEITDPIYQVIPSTQLHFLQYFCFAVSCVAVNIQILYFSVGRQYASSNINRVQLHNELMILFCWLFKHRQCLLSSRKLICNQIQISNSESHSPVCNLVQWGERFRVDHSILNVLVRHFLHGVGPSCLAPSKSAVGGTWTATRRKPIQSKWFHVHDDVFNITIIHVKIPSQNINIAFVFIGAHPLQNFLNVLLSSYKVLREIIIKILNVDHLILASTSPKGDTLSCIMGHLNIGRVQNWELRENGQISSSTPDNRISVLQHKIIDEFVSQVFLLEFVIFGSPLKTNNIIFISEGDKLVHRIFDI